MGAIQKKDDSVNNFGNFLSQLKDDFEAKKSVATMAFDREAEYAKQIITGNPYSLKLARGNTQSLINAVMRVASIGISLNPAVSWAYLVPRDGGICLDISYRGLCKLATDTGVVEFVQALPVYTNDTFKRNGVDKEPTHDFDEFAALEQRGELRGVYCIAKLSSGVYLTDMMNIERLHDIRARSTSYAGAISKGHKNSPWITDYMEMCLKSVVKHASKMWPASTGSERFGEAVHLLNKQDGNLSIDDAIDAAVINAQEKAESASARTALLDTYELALTNGNASLLYSMSKALSQRELMDVYNAGDSGNKQARKAKITELEQQGFQFMKDSAEQLDACCANNDGPGASELVSDYSIMEHSTLFSLCSQPTQQWIKTLENAK